MTGIVPVFFFRHALCGEWRLDLGKQHSGGAFECLLEGHRAVGRSASGSTLTLVIGSSMRT